MDLAYLIKESELLQHSASFKFPLRAGVKEWERQLHGPWISSKEILTERVQEILRLREHPEICEETLEILESLEESEKTVVEYVSSDTSNTAEEQIFFKGEHTKVLNHIPFLIFIFVFLKVWVAPCLALLTPLLLCVMPYIIMTTVMNMNLPWEIYVKMMKHMFFGFQNGESWGAKHYAQTLWTGLSIGQGMITPFMTAYHTSKLDATIMKRGKALLNLREKGQYLLERLRSIGVLKQIRYDFPEISNEPHEAVAWMEEEPIGMLLLWRILGRISVITKIASDSSWNPVSWSGPLSLTNMSDLAISRRKAKKSDLVLKGHSLLTGPNRGGKSSCLRAVLQQVLLGQTFGFTYGAKGSWKPFALIFTRLKSHDSAGKESLFEMEVRMASKILHTTRSQGRNTLIMIDELFHSTNPPDAETSARLFLKQLWKLDSCKSIISTHIFSLCEAVPNTIRTLCCPATVLPTGILQYSYELQSGICKISSVHEVLKEHGMRA